MQRPHTTLALIAAAVVVVTACGGDDDSDATNGGLTIESDADGIITDDPVDELPEVGDIVPLEDFEETEMPPQATIDVEMDELRAVAAELFDGNDQGRGVGTIAGSSHFIVQVDPDDFTDDELVAGCEGMTDFVYDLPEEQAVGPVAILVSADMMVGPDEQYLVVNDGLVPRESRGTCVRQN